MTLERTPVLEIAPGESALNDRIRGMGERLARENTEREQRARRRTPSGPFTQTIAEATASSARESSSGAAAAADLAATTDALLTGTTTSARVDPDALTVTADHPERVPPFWRS